MIEPGRQAVQHFISHRDEVLLGMGAVLFPNADWSTQRGRVKGLFARLDMDGDVEGFTDRWRFSPADVEQVRLPMADGTVFDMRVYLQAQREATQWLNARVETRIGMAGFISAWLTQHKPHKRHHERTVKSFCFQEAESISRDAKAAWCRANGHAVLSLQHDGIVIAMADGTDLSTACEMMRRASEHELGYEQQCEVKEPEMPTGVARPAHCSKEVAERLVQREVGHARGPQQAPPLQAVTAHGVRLHAPAWDDAQFTAATCDQLCADPVLRLHLRSRKMEEGEGLTSRTGIQVMLDAGERTVMRERGQAGGSKAVEETAHALAASLDLHAHHHFTHAAAVDGSCKEEVGDDGKYRRFLAYGVFEGMHRMDDGGGLWGGRVDADLEIADAEMAAIHAYMAEVVRREGQHASEARLLVQSDCLGVLDAIESAWQRHDATALPKMDRGAMLESICRLREQLGRVVFLFTPSHRGIAPNAYADAAAKSHLHAPLLDLSDGVHARVLSRPCVYCVDSDFARDGTLQPATGASEPRRILWDRGVFSAARKRVGRWLHRSMADGLSALPVDATFIGRRGHPSESTTYAAVVKLGVTCRKLDSKESEPVERMAEDSQRVSIVMAARQGRALGVRGAHDEQWRWAMAAERRTGVAGWAARHGRRGCPGCIPTPPVMDSCPRCNGWNGRGRRGHVELARPGCVDRRLCGTCGGGVGSERKGKVPTSSAMRRAVNVTARDAMAGRAATLDGWHEGSRRVRRLGTDEEEAFERPPHWMGFAGLARTVVERLLRDGDLDGGQLGDTAAERIADVRHVLGGRCRASPEYQAARDEMEAAVRGVERAIITCGGEGSALLDRVRLARAYLSPRGGAADGDPAGGWEALRSLIACDAPEPDWKLAGGLTASERAEMWKAVDDRITKSWRDIITAAHEIRLTWQRATEREAQRRSDLEAGRGVLRVLLRAWREVTDDVRAGAAKWEQRWSAPGERGLRLARRLEFGPGGSRWRAEEGWRMRMLLAWMRLCRAGAVAKARQRSGRWQRQERERRGAQAWTAWEGTTSSAPRQTTGWHEDCPVLREAIERQHGATSGAAAVIARRRPRAPADDSQQPKRARPAQRGDSVGEGSSRRGEGRDAGGSSGDERAGEAASPAGSRRLDGDERCDTRSHTHTAAPRLGNGLPVRETRAELDHQQQQRQQQQQQQQPPPQRQQAPCMRLGQHDRVDGEAHAELQDGAVERDAAQQMGSVAQQQQLEHHQQQQRLRRQQAQPANGPAPPSNNTTSGSTSTRADSSNNGSSSSGGSSSSNSRGVGSREQRQQRQHAGGARARAARTSLVARCCCCECCCEEAA